MIYVGILKKWHSGTYTADVQLTTSATYYDQVPVSRCIASADMVAGRHVLIAVPDGNPRDAVVIGVFNHDGAESPISALQWALQDDSAGQQGHHG